MAADPREITDEQGQAFWRVADAAREVHDRYQFYVWLRLHLNRFLPHDLALCLFRDEQALRVDVFHSVPISGAALAELARGRSRWWCGLDDAWMRAGRQAAVVTLESADAEPESLALRAAGFGAVVVHGFDASSGLRPESTFAFALTHADALPPRRERIADHMNLCLPVLHCTAVRSLCARVGEPPRSDSRDAVRESAASGARDVPLVVLTQRQIEIIAAVRDAKRNAEIGHMLGISAATVKNHLHTIMRKLHATNRAQAVAEAMSRRLIS